jgi:O-antigen/teichoic acid export membrane protein
VFKQRATEDYHNFGNCKSIFLKTFRNLSLLGALPFLILFIWGPELFGFVFGEKWAIAGKYAQILTPMFMLKFITNPLSYVFYIFEKQQYNLLGQLVMLVLIFVAILIGVTTKDETLLLYFFSISYSIIYLAYLVMSYRLSLGKK